MEEGQKKRKMKKEQGQKKRKAKKERRRRRGEVPKHSARESESPRPGGFRTSLRRFFKE